MNRIATGAVLLAAVFLSALLLSGCYTQLGTTMDERPRDYSYEEKDQSAYEDTTGIEEESSEDYDYARRRFYDYTYYPSVSLGFGFGFFDPWWGGCCWPAWGYYPRSWYGGYYPDYWYSGYYPGYRSNYRSGYSHNATRTFGSTRSTGVSRGSGYTSPGSYGSRAGGDRPGIGSAGIGGRIGTAGKQLTTVPPSRVTTGRRGTNGERVGKSSGGTYNRGGAARGSGGRESDKMGRGEERRWVPPVPHSTEPRGGGERSGGRSYSPPPPPQPSSPPHSSGGGSRGGDSGGGSRGGNRR